VRLRQKHFPFPPVSRVPFAALPLPGAVCAELFSLPCINVGSVGGIAATVDRRSERQSLSALHCGKAAKPD
jgi:hypothetical protein